MFINFGQYSEYHKCIQVTKTEKEQLFSGNKNLKNYTSFMCVKYLSVNFNE